MLQEPERTRSILLSAIFTLPATGIHNLRLTGSHLHLYIMCYNMKLYRLKQLATSVLEYEGKAQCSMPRSTSVSLSQRCCANFSL